MSSNDIYAEIYRATAEGRPFVVATLVKSVGSTPRVSGAKMLVYLDGSIFGTIGGGLFEKLVIEDSIGLMAKGATTHLKDYHLKETGPEAIGMCCGGQAEVFFEVFAVPDRLIIFGGGHIGRDLVKVASGLNFKIVVVDERPDILAQYAAPVETRLTDPDYQTNYPPIDEQTYVVIVTHGHKCDKEVLARVAGLGCAYVGMIGSKAKIAKTFKRLEEEGIEKLHLDKVRAPIGLEIGAEGPYEIAVAIAAELVAVRRKKLKAT